MKLPHQSRTDQESKSNARDDNGSAREVILVRRATDDNTRRKRGGLFSSSGTEIGEKGKWLSPGREVSGSSLRSTSGGAPGADANGLATVGGVDARRYAEGLLQFL